MSVARLVDEADALQIDLYLESLLSARGRRPRVVEGLDLDAEQLATADLLATRFVRFHPSFRFEEALAARLRVQAGDPPGPGQLIALPIASDAEKDTPVRAVAANVARRRVIIGGAIASGVSLAGAALFAWRVRSGARTPFGRAARAAHRGRPTTMRHA
ncbi:MAG: hypothetical protein ACRDF7_02460 [Candidatus Limnocylindrales bacterium]